MTRVKRGVAGQKRHRNVIRRAKGFDNRRSTNFRAAREALLHAETYAYRDRRNKKRDFRALWLQRANAALRENGTTWSRFAGKLKNAGVELNRKSLSELAVRFPKAFDNLVSQINK